MKTRAAYKASLCLLALLFILQGLYIGAAGETAGMSIGASVATEGVAVSENYTLRMTAADAGCPMPGGKSGGTYDLTFAGAGSQTFPAMSFTNPGNYQYTIAQVAGNHALAVSYDTGVYDLRVQVRENAGRLQLTAIMNRQGSDKKAASADFRNVYVAPAVAEHNPPVKKIITGEKPKTAATFKFNLKAISNTAGVAVMPMPEGSANGVKQISTTAGVEKEFGTMTFHAPGKYVYQIREVNDAQAGYTYDKSVYTVTYTVVRQGNALTCSRAVTRKRKAFANAKYVFKNRYKKPKTTGGSGKSSSSNPTGGTPWNKSTQTKTKVTGTKVWEDNDNISSTRPENITVRLYANGELVDAKPKWKSKSGNKWSFVFEKLDEKDENGSTIEYTVGEDEVPFYESSIDGTTITNKLVPREGKAQTDISGQKTWLNEEGTEDTRPESITLRLLRDGKEVDRKTVDASADWKYAFGELPADDGYGHKYEYTVKEDPVEGYFPRYKGYDVYNTKLPPGTEKEDFDGFVNLLESRLGALTEEELEDLMSLFGYKPASSGLLPTGDDIPLWPIAFGAVGLLALAVLLILERKRKA